MSLIKRVFGTPASKQNFITIRLARKIYYPGEVVSGSILFSVAEAQKFDEFYVQFMGIEETSIQVNKSESVYINGKSWTKNYTMTYHESILYFKTKIRLLDHKCTFAPGEYIFPFNFQLPSNIPGSFTTKNIIGNRSPVGIVKYQVKTKAKSSGMLISDLTQACEFTVTERLYRNINTSQVSQDTHVTILCCFPRGKVNVVAFMDKDAYVPGEIAQLRLFLDTTQSRVKHSSIKVHLRQAVYITAEGHPSKVAKVLCTTKTFGVSANEKVERYLEFPIPKNCSVSIKSRLIACQHEILVELPVSWSPNVVIKQPVCLYRATGHAEGIFFCKAAPCVGAVHPPMNEPPAYCEYYSDRDNTLNEGEGADNISLSPTASGF